MITKLCGFVPRSTQDVFNAVIDGGYYTEDTTTLSEKYMCLAITMARSNSVITGKEAYAARKELAGYLGHYSVLSVLSHHLRTNNLPSAFTDCLAVYQDWANRP